MVHNRKRLYEEHPVLSRTTTDTLQQLHKKWLDKPEDLTVQQRVDSSTWHRRAIGGDYTACGKKVDHRFNVGVRHESYVGDLCRDGCFSAFELEMSDKLNAAEQQKHEEFLKGVEGDFEERAARREARKKTNGEE